MTKARGCIDGVPISNCDEDIPQKYKDAAKIADMFEEIIRLRKALEFYADSKDWAEFISTGNIFDEQDGDPVMAFQKGEDAPWQTAKWALEDVDKDSNGQ